MNLKGYCTTNTIINLFLQFPCTDAFSIGCIFYYVLTCGQHPYGGRFERSGNILSTEYSVKSVDDNLFEDYCSQCGNHLISQLLTPDYEQRILPGTIEQHAFFYSKSSCFVKCEHIVTL